MLYVLCSKKIRSTICRSRAIPALHRGNNSLYSVSNKQLRDNATSLNKDKLFHTSSWKKSYKTTDNLASNGMTNFLLLGSASIGYIVYKNNEGNIVSENSEKTGNFKLKNSMDYPLKNATIIATSAQDDRGGENLEIVKKDEFEHLHKEWDDFMHTAIYGEDEDDDDDEEDEDDDEDDDEENNDDGDTDDDEDDSLNENTSNNVQNDTEENGEIQEGNVNKSENENIELKNEKDLPLSTFALEPDYSLLPEEDEPTTCSICLINRQGPCRNQWRWFEKCMKQSSTQSSDEMSEEEKPNDNSIDQDTDVEQSNEGDDLDQNETNDSSASSSDFNLCMKASMVWMECVDQHRALYSYYTNRHFQPELIHMEQNILEVNKFNSFPVNMKPSLDLISYQEFMDVSNAMTDEIEILIPQNTETTDSNLKSEDSNDNEHKSQANVIKKNDPDIESDVVHDNNDKKSPPEHLIPSYAKIQLLDKDTNYPIEIGYIKDQNGDLLGFDYFSREKKENLPSGDITFHLTPETTSVSVYCLYRKPKVNDKDEDQKENINSSDDGENVSNQEEKLYYSTIKLASYLSDEQ